MLRTITRLLPLGLALSVLLSPSADAGCPRNRYDVAGTRTPGIETQGNVRFGIGCSDFVAEFDFDLLPALGVPDVRFFGSYEELNLFLISFWTMDGTGPAGTTPASGTGIRLLFGLLTFGTIENAGNTYSFAGSLNLTPNVDRARAQPWSIPHDLRTSREFQRLVADRSRGLETWI